MVEKNILHVLISFCFLFLSSALFALAVNMGGLATAVLLKYPVTMISNNLLQMLTASYLYFFVLSIVLYLKGLNADKSMLNPAANTGRGLLF